MPVRKSILRVCIILATIFASVAAAQNTRAARKPDVAYVPTTNAAVEAMLRLADVTSSDTVYDLGCGGGRQATGSSRRGYRYQSSANQRESRECEKGRCREAGPFRGK